MSDISPLCLCTSGAINWQAWEAIGTVSAAVVALLIAIVAPPFQHWWVQRQDRLQSNDECHTCLLRALDELHPIGISISKQDAQKAGDAAIEARLSTTMLDIESTLKRSTSAEARAILLKVTTPIAMLGFALTQGSRTNPLGRHTIESEEKAYDSARDALRSALEAAQLLPR